MFLGKITKKQRIVSAVILAALLLLGGAVLLVRKLSVLPAAPAALSQEDLAKLTQPSIVRIIQHVTGTVSLPALNLDLDNLAVSIDPVKPVKPEKVDQYLSGSGFVVNPNGYILTNAHVISDETIKQMYVRDEVKTLLEEKTKGLSDADLTGMGYDYQDLLEFVQKALDIAEKNSAFDLRSEVTVLSPDSTQTGISGLIRNGFTAKVFDYDKNFLEDEKDVALIKIDAQDLPAMELGDDRAVATGDRIFVFGFPSTAELNQKNPLQASFTSGLISAAKFSQSKDFSLLQTDAKISEGSSGGPLLNDKGEAIGLVTFETSQDARTAGDNFAFAIPVSLAKPLLQSNGVVNAPGNYLTHFAKGLGYYSTRQCKLANQEFFAALQTIQQFGVSKYINPYIQDCDAKIAQGSSLDSTWQRFFFQLKALSSFTWFVVGGRMVLVLLLSWVFWIVFSKLKRDEMEMDELSAKLEQEESEKKELLDQLAKKGVQLPAPEAELLAGARLELDIPHPHIVDFVKEAREIGLKDGHISEELGKAGWSREEISRALQTVL